MLRKIRRKYERKYDHDNFDNDCWVSTGLISPGLLHPSREALELGETVGKTRMKCTNYQLMSTWVGLETESDQGQPNLSDS